MTLASQFFYSLDEQPSGNTLQDCLTTFIPKNDTSPKWFDRPCEEKKTTRKSPGHRFMCECNVPDEIENPPSMIFLNFLEYYRSLNFKSTFFTAGS